MNRLSLNREIDKIFRAEQESQVKADKMAEKLEDKIKGDDIKLLIEDMMLRNKEGLSKKSYKYLWASLIYDKVKRELLVEKVRFLIEEEKIKFSDFIYTVFNDLKKSQSNGAFDGLDNDYNPYMVFKDFTNKL